MRTKIRIVVVLALSATCCACGKWPPYKEEIIENFHERRQAIEVLEAAFNETEYWDVTIGARQSAETRVEVDGYYQHQQIDDGTDWYNLLVAANVYTIRRSENGNLFEVLIPEKKGRNFFSYYVHEPRRESEFNECQDDYGDIPCGICTITFDAGWWFMSRWSPELILSDDEFEQVAKGNLDYLDSPEVWEDAYRKCYLDGYRRLGYPVPEE